MGGGSKKQKVGNRYFYGFILVPCRQMDALLEIEMSNKSLWTGQAADERIRINKPDAFGGDEREGGFQGDIDVQLGGNDQPVNDYYRRARRTGTGLTSLFNEPLSSAMRGCVSLVFRRPYVSANTARLPSIRTKHLNVKGVHRGWLPEKSTISPEALIRENLIFVTIEASNTAGGPGYAAARQALANLVRQMKGSTNSVAIYFRRPQTQSTSIIRFDCDDDDYEEIATFVESQVKSTTNLEVNPVNISESVAFFNQGSESTDVFVSPVFNFAPGSLEFGSIGNVISGLQGQNQDEKQTLKKHILIIASDSPSSIEISNANATISSIGEVVVSAFGFQSEGGMSFPSDLDLVDNTSFDDVPLTNDVTELTDALKRVFVSWIDMNPAHIIRCFWTDPMRGGTVSEDEIGDSFAAEADRYISEGLGLSAKFRGIDQSDSDRKEIERHVDAVSYRSNRTGKIELVSIRDDYVIDDLPVLDSSIVMDWSGLSRPRKSEIPNQLTVTYTRRDGKTGSVTRTNVAGVRRQGRVIKAQTIAYPSCTSESLAIRLCLRDLRTVTNDILSGTIPLRYLPPEIECGSVVIINEPFLNINNLVMRVSETRIGKFDDSTAWLTLSEDKYSTTQSVNIPEFDPQVEARKPKSLAYRLVTEASYIQGVFSIGQTTLDDELASEPDIGRLIATGAKADSNQIEAKLATGSGGEWVDQGVVDFEPYGVLVNNLTANPTETTFLIAFNNTLTEVNAGSLARLGSEVIRIDNLEDQGDGNVLVTCGRGCLDGVPSLHLSGSFFIVSSIVEPLSLDFIAGQSVDVKMLSRTGSGIQTLSQATTDTVVFASRAIRPYPVGKLQVEGSYTPLDVLSGDVTVTWAHRDRTLQTTPAVDDHIAESIGPEFGVTYIGVKRIFQQKIDFFAEADFFTVYDVFNDHKNFYEFEEVISPDDGTTWTANVDDGIDVFAPSDVFALNDFFLNSYTDSMTGLALGVRSLRDGYESWQTPFVVVKPLLSPINFTGV